MLLPRPPLDPELAAFLKSPAGRPLTAVLKPDRLTETRTALTARSLGDTELQSSGRREVERVLLGRGPAARNILVLKPPDQCRLGVAVLYFHGGGLVLGDERTGLPLILDWLDHLGVTVYSVDYRLAPEHPFPAAHEDCYQALELIAGAHQPSRVVLAGVSAGGGLAAGVALRWRDEQRAPLMGQMVMAPMLDDRDHPGTSRDWGHQRVWDADSNRLAWQCYLGEAPEVPDYAAPGRAADLSGLPPTYVDVCGGEIFRDEAVSFAHRTVRAGGDVELHVWAGGFHGFEEFVPESRLARRIRGTRRTWLESLIADKGQLEP